MINILLCLGREDRQDTPEMHCLASLWVLWLEGNNHVSCEDREENRGGLWGKIRPPLCFGFNLKGIY